MDEIKKKEEEEVVEEAQPGVIDNGDVNGGEDPGAANGGALEDDDILKTEENGEEVSAEDTAAAEDAANAASSDTASSEDTANAASSGEPAPESPAEKMLPQSQVNELVGKARIEGRESALRELHERYGVSDDDELNEIFGKGQTYDDLNDEFNSNKNSYKAVMAENALLKSKVDESRWEDVKLILGGKGLEVSVENIEAMLPSHPEWKGASQPVTFEEGKGVQENISNVPKQPGEEPAILRKMGNEKGEPAPGETEEERARKLFGF